MKIEEALKLTRSFKSEYEKLLINLIFTTNTVNTQQIKYFKRYDLTQPQYNLLRMLRGSHPKSLSVGDAQSRMVFPNSNVTRIVDKLIRKNLVTRTENKENRRVMNLNITEKGLTLLGVIDEDYEEVVRLMRKLSIEEINTMNELLTKLRD